MRQGSERSSYAPLERSPETVGGGYVYILGSENGERIKIGFSNSGKWGTRFRQHSAGDAFGEGGKFTVLAVVRATRHAETALKSFFRPHLVAKLEVYSADELLPYITWLRDQYFVSTTEQEFYSESGLIVMDPSVWLPAEGRVSSRRSHLGLLRAVDPWSVLPSRIVTGDDWYTPPHIVECVRLALGGHIDLDPASHVIANSIVQATTFYTRDQKGELQPFFGRVFLNPPFSDWPDWVDKVLSENNAGSMEAIVMLGATRTLSAQYFEPLLRRVDAICVISGRTPFWGIGTESDSPTDGHFLLYIGPEVDRFVCAVSSLGATWISQRTAA